MRASVVVAARNEERRIATALESLAALRTAFPYEVIVVDASDDATPDVVRSFDGVRLVAGTGDGRGVDRNRGAAAAEGEYLAFVDADTVVRPTYLAEMVRFVDRRGLVGATSRFGFHDTNSLRARVVAGVGNAYLDRVENPCLPGFNAVVPTAAFDAVGGFPDAPNEDVGLSRRLRDRGPTAVHPDRLVATSGRRVERLGLVALAGYYLRKEIRRAADGSPAESDALRRRNDE